MCSNSLERIFVCRRVFNSGTGLVFHSNVHQNKDLVAGDSTGESFHQRGICLETYEAIN